MNLKKTFVIGLGPGRCGSSSLSWLLNEQEDSHVSHELFPILPWNTDSNQFIQFRWEQLHHLSSNWSFVGDVAAYYLPWVPFLMNSYESIPHLKENFNFRFVVLERPVDEIVTSYLAKFKKNNNNPLQNHGDDSLVVNEWDGSYPKYDGVPLEDAIKMYATDYYSRCRDLAEKYPDSFKIFDYNCLNTDAGVNSILGFIGYPKPNSLAEVRKNVG